MERKVCDWCGKPIEKVDKKKETEEGVSCDLRMKGNARIREFPFSKTFDVNLFFILCDDCAKKSIDTFVQCSQECIATKKAVQNERQRRVKNGKQKGSSNELPPKCESDVLS